MNVDAKEEYYERNFKTKNKEYRTLKDLSEDDDKTPTNIIKDGKNLNKPAEIAKEMSKFFCVLWLCVWVTGEEVDKLRDWEGDLAWEAGEVPGCRFSLCV